MSTPMRTTGHLPGRIDAAVLSDTGVVRAVNEDRALLTSWGSATLAVIADGMGSYGGGDIAAELAIEAFCDIADSALPATTVECADLLLGCFYTADQAIRAQRGNVHPDMGATVIAALLHDDWLIHLHAGDCRLYHARTGKIIERTRDHSAVQVLVESGRITEDEALTHPMRSLVTSCLGGPGEVGRLSVDPAPPFDGEEGCIHQVTCDDVILLCSDGLWGVVGGRVIEDALMSNYLDANGSTKLVNHLVERAIAAGAPDNVTAIALRQAR